LSNPHVQGAAIAIRRIALAASRNLGPGFNIDSIKNLLPPQAREEDLRILAYSVIAEIPTMREPASHARGADQAATVRERFVESATVI